MMNILNIHKSVYAISEPFNVGNKENYRSLKKGLISDKEIANEQELDKSLKKLFGEFNCIKHIWHPAGFPFLEKNPEYAFDDTVTLNEVILSKFDFVIFLKRKNYLKRIVSVLMSNQTDFWEPTRNPDNLDEQIQKSVNFNYKPLNMESIKWHLEFEDFYINYFREALIKSQVKYRELFHEDFIANKCHYGIKKDNFYNLLEFLELPDNFNHDQILLMQDYLGSKLKLNSVNSYNKVPNIQELESEFGSDEKGWIFKAVF